MIQIIAGPRGTGKTNELIKRANDALDVCKGSIVFLTDTSDYSLSVKTAIRFINVTEYGKLDERYLVGFINGLLASNSDVSRLYVDGLARMLKTSAEDMEELLIALDGISERSRVDMYISVTCDKPPKFMKKYL
ncbi:MAG: hypothetical protein IJX05_03215 [Clostridia bacterium]|nr:hypothetical protein [Clostridia bacterium]